MSIEALLAELRSLGVRLWTDDGRLLFSAPRGSLSDDLRERIRSHKPELLSLLGGLQSRQRLAPQALSDTAAQDRAPLSYSQQRLWFLAQMEPDSGGYNIPVALRLDGRLDLVLLQEALDRVVARHEALRTTVATEHEQASQLVHPVIRVRIETEELEPARVAEQEATVRRRLEQEALRPFNLERGPLLRALLLRLAPTQHVLLLTLHHIVGDGWSLGVLNRELSACYNALVRGTDPALPALHVQYTDYARWQREYLQGPELQRQLDYWKSRLAGLEQLSLPTDKPRPAYLSGQGGSVRFSLSRELSEALYATGSRSGVTPFMLLLAAFAVLLSRYSGQSDIAVGTPIAGRRHGEFENLIGFFVNTLVMRTDLAGDPSFDEVLRRVRHTALDAYDHQDLPFERLVEELAPARDRSRNPLFQVMFAFQNAPEVPLQLHGLEVARFPLDLRSEKFDLSLTMRTTPDGLVGSFSYSRDLFDAASVERMSGCFRRLLESIVAGPERRVHALEMLGDRELQTLLLDWNATARCFSADVCIHTMIERQAARVPTRVAVVCDGAQLSYAELNARANQLAHFLRAQDVVPDQLVGLCIGPSLEMVVAIVGVLKAGGAYVPMDPGYPADRLAFMREDSGVALVLGIGEVPPAAQAARTVLLDRDWGEISRYPASDPVAVVDGSNLAYMIYTSGSTGRPKGVLIEHRSVRNLAEGLRERLAYESFGRPLRNCLSASISFDASVDNWVMLAFGDELHVIGQELRADGSALLRYVREQQIDVLDCAPAQLALLLEEGLLDAAWVPPIITVGGEAVDPQLWSRLAGDGRVAPYNLYGPTECTVEAVVARIGADCPTPVIGRPLANSRIYLLDGHGGPVPPGAVGEIHIGGDGLARGYHRRPELTAEKFAMHTLPGQAPQRLYRTGDFGRVLPDGTLVFLGRRDGQVKLRGYRIELGEIEAVIAPMPGVLGVTALVREDDPGHSCLVAYVRGDPVVMPGVDELREMAQSKLPAYMVPAAFVIVDRFPLTPSGKIDRKALPRPDFASLGMHSGYAAPETELQRQLSGIWGAFIAAGRIGIDDDFFELGGHSLLATRVINRINRDCGVNLALRVLFEQPTIRRLSAAIEQLADSGDAATTRAEAPIAVQPRVARKRPKPEE